MGNILCFGLCLVLDLVVIARVIPKRPAYLPIFVKPLLASLAMVACSVLFSWFIGLSSRYTLVYGSLASLIILLVWLYFCGNILLLGAIFGQVAARRGERRRQGPPA